jgi:hypothetical protein
LPRHGGEDELLPRGRFYFIQLFLLAVRFILFPILLTLAAAVNDDGDDDGQVSETDSDYSFAPLHLHPDVAAEASGGYCTPPARSGPTPNVESSANLVAAPPSPRRRRPDIFADAGKAAPAEEVVTTLAMPLRSPATWR